MSKRQYSTSRSRAARAKVAAMLPALCFRCQGIVTSEMRWHADHPLSRVEGEARGMSDHELDAMVLPAHASCDSKAGAVLGNKLKAEAKRQPRQIAKIVRPQPNSGFFQESLDTPAAALPILSPDASL